MRRPSLGILAFLLCLSPCLAQPFEGGLYTSRTKEGTISWQLFFSQRPGHSFYDVSGQSGDGALAIGVSGRYYPKTDQMNCSMLRADALSGAISSAVGVDLPTEALLEVRGHWAPSDPPGFMVQIEGVNKAPEKLTLDPRSPDPGRPLIEMSLDLPSPQVMGTPLQGTARFRVRGVTEPFEALLYLTGKDQRGATAVLRIDEDDDHEVAIQDLIPMTVPFDIQSDGNTEVLLKLINGTNFAYERWDTAASLRVLRPKGSVWAVSNDSSTVRPAEPVMGNPATLQLRYKLRHARIVDVRVEQDVVIESLETGKVVFSLPKRDFFSAATPDGKEILGSEGRYEFDAPSPGRYRARYTITGDDVMPYTGAVIFDVLPADRKPGGQTDDEKSQPKPKINLTGGVTVSPGKIKAGEKLQTTVTMTNPDTGEDVQVDCTLCISKATDWGTQMISQKTKKYTITKGETKKGEPSVKLTVPGEYILELLGVGDRVEKFRSEATIIVEPNDAPATTDSTSPPPVNATPAGGMKGKFGLIKKQLGKIPPATEGPDGTSSGSIGESSFNATYIVKAPGEGTFTCQSAWEPPKQVYQAGEIIELKCRGSATANGRDVPNLGVDTAWGVGDSAEIIEKKGTTYSGKGGDGKFYPSSDTTYRVKIGQGGTMTLTAFYYGVAWGTQSMEPPCIYTYQWEADPTAQPGSGEAPKPKPGGASEKPKPDPSTLTWNTPDDPDDAKQIDAWLDPMEITLFAGETPKIVDVHIRNYRRDTAEDRVEVLFPQKTDNWASLPGQIVVTGGDGSYWPPNMGSPEHVDGYFFSARRTARGGKFTVWWIVRQKGAGAVRIPLTVNVIARPGMVNGWNKPLGAVTSPGGYKPLPEGAVPRGQVPRGEDEMRRKPVGPGEVVVPDLATCATVRDMKAMLGDVGLTGTFLSAGNPPTKDLEFKVSGQSPVAGAKVSIGSAVTVGIYQQYDPGIPPGQPVHRSNNAGTASAGMPANPMPAGATTTGGVAALPPPPSAAHVSPKGMEPPSGRLPPEGNNGSANAQPTAGGMTGSTGSKPPGTDRVTTTNGMSGTTGGLIMNAMPPGKLAADAFGVSGIQLAASAGIPAIYDVDASMAAPPAVTKVMLLGDKHQTQFTLTLNPPVERFAIQRIGTRNGSSLPTWKMTAYDAANQVIGTTGEQRGQPAEWKLFEIKGAGITRITIETDNLVNGAPWATWSSLPITGFLFDR